MGCSNDSSIQVDYEETNQNQELDNELLAMKDFHDFEEYSSKYFKLKIIYFK